MILGEIFADQEFLDLKICCILRKNIQTIFFQLLDVDDTRPGEHYPFAVASFNITMMLFEILGWGWKTPGKSTAKNSSVFFRCISFMFSENYSLERAENIFNELFSLSMVVMDKNWYEMNAGYMDFPKVLTQTQNQLEVLIVAFLSLEDLFVYNRVHLE